MTEQKQYQFTRSATYTQFGFVYATSEEEARERILDDDYDDIIDTYYESFDPSTIQISEGE